MTGRDKVEAAFSAAGARETAVVICYEGIYARDHWNDLTMCPWWYAQSPDVDHQFAWRRDVIEKAGQDWFILPSAASREARADVRIVTSGPRITIIGQAATAQELAAHLTRALDRPVKDQTGTGARYDFVLTFSSEGTDTPGVFAALLSQLGLKLNAQKEPVEMIVIDHAERNPAAN